MNKQHNEKTNVRKIHNEIETKHTEILNTHLLFKIHSQRDLQNTPRDVKNTPRDFKNTQRDFKNIHRDFYKYTPKSKRHI